MRPFTNKEIKHFNSWSFLRRELLDYELTKAQMAIFKAQHAELMKSFGPPCPEWNPGCMCCAVWYGFRTFVYTVVR